MATRTRVARNWFILVVVIAAFAFVLPGCMANPTMPDLSGMTYSQASDALKQAGLSSYVTYVDRDGSEATNLAGDDLVEGQSPAAGNEASRSTDSVTVVVHSKANELTSILTAANGQTVSSVSAQVAALGYTATYYHETSREDYTSIVENDIANPTDPDHTDWILVGMGNPDTEDKTVQILVQSPEVWQQEQMESELEATLSSDYAWECLEEAGRQQYPYGFDLHSVMGIITQEPVNSTTWHLAAYCDVTNAFGATASDLVCDADVVAHDGIVSVTNMTIS